MKVYKLTLMVLVLFMVTSCDKKNTGVSYDTKEPRVYNVKKLNGPISIDADWDKPQWKGVQALDVALYMGEKPEHMPKTQAKLMYDDANIYVIFRVEDQYVRAVVDKLHGPVCTDSCVEFFFTPESEIQNGYFNMEMTAGGIFLLCHQKERGVDVASLDPALCQQIEVAHSLPSKVDPEITDPVIWTVEYRIPVEILKSSSPVDMPAPGVKWRANFYKCGDLTSKPHWFTWSFVDKPQPDFHRPDYFGFLVFE